MLFKTLKILNLKQRKLCLENLKLRNQFILIVGVLVILIVGLFAIWNLIHQQILSSLFLEESDKLFEQNSKKRIEEMLQLYKMYLYQIFALSTNQQKLLDGNALVSFHRLYLKTKKEVMIRSLNINENYQMEYEGTKQIPDPLRILNEYGSNISNSFMCYSNTSAYDNPLTQEQKIGIKLSEQIQAYGQILYQGSLIMQSNIYSYIYKQKINSVYPCVNRGKGIYTYLPEKRDWYKVLNQTYFNSTNYNSYKLKFTPPYLLFTFQTVGLSLTLPIVDENLQFVGGVASTFLGAKLTQYLSNNETGFQLIFLAAGDGTLIMHPFNVSAKLLPIYIYNETITGFNQTDWEEMKSINGISTCTNLQLNLQMFCRYNSMTLQEMIVSIQKFQEYDMYLIMLLSINEYITFTNSFHDQLKQDINNTTIRQIIYLLIAFLCLTIVILIITKILFLPIELIVKTTQVLIHNNQKSKVYLASKFITFFMSSQIQSLQRSFEYFYKLLELLSFHKTEQCVQIEETKYPSKQIQLWPYIMSYEEAGYTIIFKDNHNRLNDRIRSKKLLNYFVTSTLQTQKNQNYEQKV